LKYWYVVRSILIFITFYPLLLNANPITYFVIEHQAEPFQIINDKGQHRGIISDIITHVLQNSTASLIPKAYPFKRMLHMMEKEKDEHWLSYGSPAWESSSNVEVQNNRLSQHPLFNVSHLLLTETKTPFEFSNIEDLFGHTVITLKGFTYPGLDPYLASGQIKQIEVGSHNNALMALKAKRGLAFVAMKSRILYTLNTSEVKSDQYRFTDFSSVINAYPIHLAYSNGLSKELINLIENRILQLKQSGEIEVIIQRYQS
jgi:polar amino acid transport system substrate-binding protein